MKKEEYKALKRPDVLQKKFFQFLDSVVANKNQVIAAASVTILIVLGIVGYIAYERAQTEKRQEELARLDDQLMDVEKITAESRQKKQVEINKIKAEIKSKTQAEEKAENQTDKDKLQQEIANLRKIEQQFQAELEQIKPRYEKVIEDYQQFLTQYASLPEGKKAGMSAVQLLIQDKQFTKASEILGSIFKGDLPDVDFYQIQARYLYISVLEELKEFEKALEVSQKLMDLASKEFLPKAILVHGRLQYFSGQQDEARRLLDKIIKEHAATPEAAKARALKFVWK